MPRAKPKPAGKPMLEVEVEFAGEDWTVEIIVPTWAMHKKNGGEPSDSFEDEGGESMWDLYVEEQGQKMAKRAFEKKAAEEKAKEKVANDKRVASLKAAFDVFDEDGSGTLSTEEVKIILTRMTGNSTPLTTADAQAFITEFDRDGDGLLDVNEFIVAMGVMSDAVDEDNDGVIDGKDAGGGAYDGKEEEFATKLAEGETINVAGVGTGDISVAVDEARRVQK